MSDLPPAPPKRARVLALGDLRIFDAEGHSVISLEAQPKRAALLIYLACLPEGSFCSRDQLLALFWPDFDDERARNSLRTSLYYVRRAIGPGVVLSRPDGALETDARVLGCDVRAFETAIGEGRWAEAAELYRGDFLEGTGQSVSVELDQWVEATRRRLRRQCADALYLLAEKRERDGELEGALEAMGRARQLLPADEAIVRKVLLLWGRAGHRVRAVQEYEAFAETLSVLYELEPSEETRHILAQVTGNAFSPDRSRPGPLPPPPAATPGLVVPEVVHPGGTVVEAPSSPGRSRGWRLAQLSVVAGLVVAAFALGRTRSEAHLPTRNEVVAVLPFELTGEGEAQTVAEALPTLLSDELRSSGRAVLDPQSLEGRGARWTDQVTRARELGAGMVVTGWVIAMADSVAVLVATVPTSGHPVPREWARVTGRPSDLGPLAAALGRQLGVRQR
ncbi:MAG TPA: BTAD domain-containing putative transcriptional regulator [Longimicrobiales bacterium]|nr:BTAD domain-containing putative transcriptional regulator [Longimicrobiales bacterium]